MYVDIIGWQGIPWRHLQEMPVPSDDTNQEIRWQECGSFTST